MQWHRICKDLSVLIWGISVYFLFSLLQPNIVLFSWSFKGAKIELLCVTHRYIHTYTCVHTQMCPWIYTYIHMPTHVLTCNTVIHACIHVSTCKCMHRHAHIHTHTHMHIYTHICGINFSTFFVRQLSTDNRVPWFLSERVFSFLSRLKDNFTICGLRSVGCFL